MLDKLNAKIERAEENILNLERELATFLAGNPFRSIQEDDPQSGDRTFSLKIDAEIPLRFGVLVGEIIHNLRSTLDHMICHLVVKNNATPHFGTGFPVYKTAVDFDRNAGEKIGGVSADVARAIRATKPYKGGNDRLYRLHRLSIIDKHRAPLLLVATATPNLRLTIGKPVSYKHSFPPYKDGMELLGAHRVAGEREVNIDAEFTFYVTLSEKEFPTGEQLIPAIYQLMDVVKGTVAMFEGFL